MKLRTLVAGGAAGLLGAVGAVAGYQSVMAHPTWRNTAAEESTAVAKPVAPTPKVRIRFERCPRGFHLHDGACERIVQRTVVVTVVKPAPVVAAPAPVSAPARQDGGGSGPSHHGDDDSHSSHHESSDDHAAEPGDDGEHEEPGDDDGGEHEEPGDD